MSTLVSILWSSCVAKSAPVGVVRFVASNEHEEPSAENRGTMASRPQCVRISVRTAHSPRWGMQCLHS